MALWALAHVPGALVSWHFVMSGATLLVSWHFVMSGATLLVSPGRVSGLHLYATHPELQMGPLTFLAASPFSLDLGLTRETAEARGRLQHMDPDREPEAYQATCSPG